MISLSAEVHAHWHDIAPVYRIYVNNDLITERTFGWPGYLNYIKEHLICHLDPGIHVIKIENVFGQGELKLENLIVDGRTDNVHPNYFDPEGKQITFYIRQ